MSTNATASPDSPRLWVRACFFVAAALPAAFLTWLGSGLSKAPSDFVREWGELFPCLVLVVAALLAFVAEACVRSFNPGAIGGAFGLGMLVSFGVSMLTFLGIMYSFID